MLYAVAAGEPLVATGTVTRTFQDSRDIISPPATTGGGFRVVTQTLRIDPTRKNVVEITAYNGQGLLASLPYHLEIDKFRGDNRTGAHVHRCRGGQLLCQAGAKAISDTLTAVAHDLYAEPKVVSILNKDATAKGIEAAINSLKGDVKASDVFVLNVAGHGRSIAGTYYFLHLDVPFFGLTKLFIPCFDQGGIEGCAFLRRIEPNVL
jgi:hypothetical protein